MRFDLAKEREGGTAGGGGGGGGGGWSGLVVLGRGRGESGCLEGADVVEGEV